MKTVHRSEYTIKHGWSSQTTKANFLTCTGPGEGKRGEKFTLESPTDASREVKWMVPPAGVDFIPVNTVLPSPSRFTTRVRHNKSRKANKRSSSEVKRDPDIKIGVVTYQYYRRYLSSYVTTEGGQTTQRRELESCGAETPLVVKRDRTVGERRGLLVVLGLSFWENDPS